MIFPQEKDTFSNAKAQYESPTLLDRIFSFLIDYLILSPFVSFAIYLLFQDSLGYFKKFPTAPENQLMGVLIVVSYISIFALFQALFLAFASATPGHYFLKLQYQFNHGRHLVLWRSFLRQLGFGFSFFLLGIPWLALFIHPLQQAFYDRLADGQLISLKKNNDYLFFEKEPQYWTSFYSTCLVFCLAIGGIYFSFKRTEVNMRVASYDKAKTEKQLCKELDTVSDAQRLKFAIAMNLTGQLSDDCLDREADFVLWKEIKSLMGLAYFAKSMTETSSDIIEKYIAQSCSVDADFSCPLSNAFNTHEFTGLEATLAKEDGILGDVLRYEVEALKDSSSNKLAELREKIEKYDSHRLVKKYLISEAVRDTHLVDHKRKWAVEETDEKEISSSEGRSPAQVHRKQKKFQDWLDNL